MSTVSLGKWFGSKGKQHRKHTASQTQSHTQWSHQKYRKPHEIFPKQLRPGISTSLSITDLFLPRTALQWCVVFKYRIRQLGPRNGTEYYLLHICFCIAVWLCLKMGSENLVLMRLLQIGAKDLTVWVTYSHTVTYIQSHFIMVYTVKKPHSELHIFKQTHSQLCTLIKPHSEKHTAIIPHCKLH